LFSIIVTHRSAKHFQHTYDYERDTRSRQIPIVKPKIDQNMELVLQLQLLLHWLQLLRLIITNQMPVHTQSWYNNTK